jgi:hypothetical protein
MLRRCRSRRGPSSIQFARAADSEVKVTEEQIKNPHTKDRRGGRPKIPISIHALATRRTIKGGTRVCMIQVRRGYNPWAMRKWFLGVGAAAACILLGMGWGMSGIIDLRGAVWCFAGSALFLVPMLWISEGFTRIPLPWKLIVGCTGTQLICLGLLFIIYFLLAHQPQPVNRADISLESINFVPREPGDVEVACMNDSDVPANDAACLSRIFLASLVNGRVSKMEQENDYAEFQRNIQMNLTNIELRTLDPHHHLIAHIKLPPPTPIDGAAILNHEKTFLISGLFIWSDDAGRHRKEFCKWLELSSPPITVGRMRSVLCDAHNRLVY